MLDLDRMLDRILDDPTGEPVRRAMQDHGHTIGYLCSYVPEALLSVPGLMPMRVRACTVAGTPMADTYLSSVLCPYVRSVLEVALDDTLPPIDGWVLTSSCDGMRRLHDNLSYLVAPAFCRIVDVPHKRGEPAAAWFERELESLASALSKHFGVDTSDAAVRASIDRTNAFRARLREASELRRVDPSPVDGAEVHRLLVAASLVPDAVLDEALEAWVAGKRQAPPREPPRARVLLVGSTLDDPRFVALIESCGAQVVADRFCHGSVPGLEPIAHHDRALHALSRHTLETTACPRMMEDFPRRLSQIESLAREAAADGIIVEAMKLCDLWGVESVALTRALRNAGWPVLRLEREYVHGGEGQVRTRVQAFLESMDR